MQCFSYEAWSCGEECVRAHMRHRRRKRRHANDRMWGQRQEARAERRAQQRRTRHEAGCEEHARDGCDLTKKGWIVSRR